MKQFGNNISKRLSKVLETHDKNELRDCIATIFDQKHAINKTLFPFIESLLIERWHQEHEDIVGLIWLRDVKDDRFIEPILTVAKNGEQYRPFDDELESTLRKCVHALKTIDTDKANLAIRRLIDSGNKNVMYALENYR